MSIQKTKIRKANLTEESTEINGYKIYSSPSLL